MLTKDQALGRLDQILTHAAGAGADAADAVYFGEESTSIGVRLGALEDISRSEGEEVGLRVFVGDRAAQVSISDLSDAALQEAASRAVAMARLATPDGFAGLAPVELLATAPFASFDLQDPAVAALSPPQLQDMAREAEDSARAVAGITNSEGATASTGASISALATSHGFRGATSGSGVSVSAVVVAGEGSGMQRDYDWHQSRHLADLDSPAAIGRTAGERAVARLNPLAAPTGPMPVVFDPRVAASLLGHLIGAISGQSVARKTSFLLDRLGEKIFSSGITIRDDPHRPRGLGSRAFDGEGLATRARDIIADGVLSGWLIDSASGRQLGLAPTGNASRGAGGPIAVSATNLWLAAGEFSPAELMADIKTGLYVTELIGMGVNLLTGDYSRGAGGFIIRDGQLAEPVAEATIAGNLADMFACLVPANDLSFRYTANAPTLRLDCMTIAGQGS